MSPETINENLAAIVARIDAARKAAVQPAPSTTLIAVTKTHGADDILPALIAGQRVFGESFDTFDRIWRELLGGGVIAESEYQAMTLPQYYKTVAELAAPQTAPDHTATDAPSGVGVARPSAKRTSSSFT